MLCGLQLKFFNCLWSLTMRRLIPHWAFDSWTFCANTKGRDQQIKSNAHNTPTPRGSHRFWEQFLPQGGTKGNTEIITEIENVDFSPIKILTKIHERGVSSQLKETIFPSSESAKLCYLALWQNAWASEIWEVAMGLLWHGDIIRPFFFCIISSYTYNVL